MQIAIGTGLLGLEPFSAAQAGRWDVPGAVGLDIPGMCHCLSLEMPQLQAQQEGAGSSSSCPGPAPCGPHPHPLHHGRTKEFLAVQGEKPYGTKGKKMSWAAAEPARIWLIF